MVGFKIRFQSHTQTYQLCDCVLVRDMEVTASLDLQAPKGSMLVRDGCPLMPYTTLKECKVTHGTILDLIAE